ncbi:MAG: hypothetical protein C6P35_08290, partial [Cohnella sp.]
MALSVWQSEDRSSVLRQQGERVSEKTVARIMQELGLK